jgi:integrase
MAWKRFEKYCLESGIEKPTRAAGMEFLTQTVFKRSKHKSYKQQQKRMIMCLFDLSENGAFPLRNGVPQTLVPKCHMSIYEEYSYFIESKNLHYRTIYLKKHLLKKLLVFLESQGVTDTGALKCDDIYAYLSFLTANSAASTKTAHLYFLREFLEFLVKAHKLEPALAKLFPVILSNKDAVLPSVYKPEELRRAINAIDHKGSNAKRDRAVILLAIQLGMRVGDIRQLRSEDIDWRNRKLSFLQNKTNCKVSLPLPEECMYAILDYMKNERPQYDSPYIFIKNRAPYGVFSYGNSFHKIVADCFKRAGIDTGGKHYGLHSLRHSIAVNMLMSDIPYPVISGVLGHTNANTTKTYLKTDVEQLRGLSLEVDYE